jgi:hypothetical protein
MTRAAPPAAKLEEVTYLSKPGLGRAGSGPAGHRRAVFGLASGLGWPRWQRHEAMYLVPAGHGTWQGPKPRFRCRKIMRGDEEIPG